MPISDSYFVQALLQQTSVHRDALEWTAKETEGFEALANGVKLAIESVATRGGPRLYLTLERDEDRAYIEEPVNTGLFQERYGSEAQEELAALLRALFCAAAEQCAERERARQRGAGREALFRLALFGEPVMPGYRSKPV